MHGWTMRPYKGFERRKKNRLQVYAILKKKSKTMETMIRSGDLGEMKKDYSFYKDWRLYFERHYKDGYMLLNLCQKP